VDEGLLRLAAIAGTVGGLLSVGAFVPQAWRILQRRSAADVSLAMYVSVVVASFLWMFYAWVHDSIELLATNAVIAVIASAIVALKLRFGSEK
jgi:MtN3 and saliva related transmembrane protein